MTIKERILDALKTTDRLCDDCLSEVTGVSPRQAINAKCRELSAARIVSRSMQDCARCKRVKTVNCLGDVVPVPRSIRVPQNIQSPARAPTERQWYWEGNVQNKIVQFLLAKGYHVESQADTQTRQQGKDIVAKCPHGGTLWVTVKGFPDRSANTQARHWFAGALHDLARYRDEDATAFLAMGLPRGFSTYEGLLRRQQSIRKFLGYRVYWVAADGAVTEEPA
jgi:hypothetical protein